MSTPLDIFEVIAAAGQKLVAALTLPTGLTTAAGTTVTGGTVTGAATVPTGASAVYVGLSESPSTYYGASADVGGTALPDATTRPYTLEVRVVAGGTDMTSYTAIAAAFAGSTTIAYTRDVPTTISGGMLKSGAWGKATLAPVQALTNLSINNPAGAAVELYAATYAFYMEGSLDGLGHASVYINNSGGGSAIAFQNASASFAAVSVVNSDPAGNGVWLEGGGKDIHSDFHGGITSLAQWLGILAGKASDAATLAEIRATAAGATYDGTTDSLEAQKDSPPGGGSHNVSITGKDVRVK